MWKSSNTSYPIAMFGGFFLFGAVLLPQGVGFVELPILQLPRLSAIALVVLGMITVLYTGRIKLVAPRTMIILAFVTCLQFISAFQSSSIGYSTQWAVNYTIILFGGAFSFLLISGNVRHRRIVVNTLLIISVLLASMAVVECVTQVKIFPYRNIYAENSTAFSTTLRRVVMVDGSRLGTPLMSLGPFSSNLTYSGFLCAFGGILMLGWRKKNVTLNCFGTALFAFSIMATQSRIGILSMLLMLIISLAITESRNKKVSILLGGLFGVGAYISFVGFSMVSMVYFEGASVSILLYMLAIFISIFFYPVIAFFASKRKALIVLFVLLPVVVLLFFFVDTSSQAMIPGSAQGRIHGLKLLLSQPKSWLLGTGPGSLVDSERVITSIKIYSDQGSFFSFIGESGILVGILLLSLVYKGIYNGLYTYDPFVQGMAVGVIGCFVTSLVSVTPNVWLIMLVFIGLIESWKRSYDVQQRTV